MIYGKEISVLRVMHFRQQKVSKTARIKGINWNLTPIYPTNYPHDAGQ